MSEHEGGTALVDAAPAIEVVGVTKTYDEGRSRALDGIDLTVARSEFLAITGPSGCGKSTLLHLLAALDRPTSGTIRVGGQEVNHLRDANRFRRQEVGLVFQLHDLLPRLSVLGNVTIAMQGSERPRAEREPHARTLLEKVGLGGRISRRPPQLSGGERQRVAIARALANDPVVLLADEPTGSLDSVSVKSVLALFGSLRTERGVTIVMVTHDDAVARTADRTIRMLDGKILSPSDNGVR